MNLLALGERGLQPDTSEVRQQMLGESENAFDIQLIDPRVVEFKLDERQFFEQSIPLTFINRVLDRPLENERLLQSFQSLVQSRLSLCKNLLNVSRPLLFCLPHVEHDGSEQPNVPRLGTKALKMPEEAGLNIVPAAAYALALRAVVVRVLAGPPR